MAGALLAPFAAGSVAEGAGAKAGAAQASREADANRAILADKVLTHVRIRGHQDGRSQYFWYRGTFYGQVTGQRTLPLLHIFGASSARMERKPDGSFGYRMREAGWFCDLETKQVVNEWKNPLNGKLVQPKHYNSAQESTIAAAGIQPAGALPPGVEYVGYVGEPSIDGDDVRTTEELLVRMPPRTPQDRARVATSLATFLAPRPALVKSPDNWVPCTLAYQTLGSWQPWLDMGDVTGVVTWRLAGRKCNRREDIPADIRERIENEHPEALGV
jgi:hypothetical protein